MASHRNLYLITSWIFNVMSCCEGVDGIERSLGTGCCGKYLNWLKRRKQSLFFFINIQTKWIDLILGTKCTAGSSGCPNSESRIRSCHCQNNVGCLDRNDCGGFRPSGTAATGACPGPCQCLEEEIWNSNVPPKPNCEWLNNFSELRRQWSNHARQQNCKCCNCRSW